MSAWVAAAALRAHVERCERCALVKPCVAGELLRAQLEGALEREALRVPPAMMARKREP